MLDLFEQFGIWALVDVLIISFIIYQLLIILRGTKAMQMVTGILIIIGSVFIFSQFYPLNTLKWLMNKFYSSFFIILVVLFQDDIRRVLSGMGKKSFLTTGEQLSSKAILDEIMRAATSLAAKRIGALIVFERNIILNRYIEIGIPIDARVSKELLHAIFHTDSPIHDGAVVIQQGRIAAAGCFLPLTRDEVDPNMGTRHRAAIGVTQETDAVVVLVSEEGGSVSLVVDGHVSRGLAPKDLRKALRNLLTNKYGDDDLPRPVKPKGAWSLIAKMRFLRNGTKK